MDVRTHCLVLLLTFASLSFTGTTSAKENSGALRRRLLSRQKRDSCMQWMALSRNCNGHGECREDDVGAHCVCLDGWTGTYCNNAPIVESIDVDPCAARPCLNEGICFRAASRNAYKCICGAGITGDHCEVTEQAPPQENNDNDNAVVTSRPQQPSQGGKDVYTEYDVRCAQLFMMSKRCNSHGYCRVDATGAFCRCYDGWSGSYCAKDSRTDNSFDNTPVAVTARIPVVDDSPQNNDVVNVRCTQLYAHSDRCSNDNGYCSVDAMGAFCKCYPGWAGTFCQYKVSTMLKMLKDMETMLTEG